MSNKSKLGVTEIKKNNETLLLSSYYIAVGGVLRGYVRPSSIRTY
jgi:hypothetical protein